MKIPRKFFISRHATVLGGTSPPILAECEDEAIAQYFRGVPLKEWEYKGNGTFKLSLFVREDGGTTNHCEVQATVVMDRGVPYLSKDEPEEPEEQQGWCTSCGTASQENPCDECFKHENL